MLSTKEQMDIIKTALSQGYKGPIYELIEQAIIQKQSQSPQQPQTPQVGTPALGGSFTEKQPPSSTERNIIKPGEYKKGGVKSEKRGDGLLSKSMINTQENMRDNDYTVEKIDPLGSQEIPVNTDDDQLKKAVPYDLVKNSSDYYTTEMRGRRGGSYVEGDDGKSEVNLRDKAGSLVWAGTQTRFTEKYGDHLERGTKEFGQENRKDRFYLNKFNTGGAVKYKNGGSHSDDFVEDGIENDFEEYVSMTELDGKEPISLSEYERLSKGPYGKNLNDFFENKDGTTGRSFSSWEKSSVKKAYPVNQVMGWSKFQQEKYYNTIYKDPEVASIVMEEDTKKYNEENPTEVTKDPMNGWTPEWTQLELDEMATPDTFKESGVWSKANLLGFNQEWNKSDRVEDTYGFMDYWKNKEDTRTYAPSYRFGDDVRADKVFYADENGNPVGKYYTDKTPYTQRIADWAGKNTDKKAAMIDDGSELQSKYEFADKVLYNYIPTAVTAPIGVSITAKAAAKAVTPIAKHVVKPLWAAANTNLLTNIAGTSTFDALNVLGVAHLAETAPENVKNMIEDPSWRNALNLGINTLEAVGGKYTAGRIASNFKKVKGNSKFDVTNITKYDKVTNRPTSEVFTNSKNVTNNITTDASKIINTKNAINNLEGPPSGGVAPNNPIGSADDLSVELGTKYKHDLTRKALEDSQDFSKTNFNSEHNKKLLNTLPEEQAANIRNTNKQMIDISNKATINYSTTIKSNIGGQSGPMKFHKIGDTRILNKGNTVHYLGQGDPIPRFSQVNINNLKLNIGDGVDESTKYYNNVRNIISHEIDHTKNMPTWGKSWFQNKPSTSGNYNYNSNTRTFNVRPGYNENQLGVIARESVVDFTTLDKIGPFQTAPTKYFSKFNPKTGTFNKVSDEGTFMEKVKTRFQAATSGVNTLKNDAALKKSLQNKMYADKKNINTDRFDNYLHYFTEPWEMTAKMNGYKSQMNFAAETHGNISASQGKKLYDNLKLTDPNFWAVFKDNKAFTEMFKKVPYAATIPIGLGLGTQIKENTSKVNLNATKIPKRKGGYRSNSSRQMLYNNGKPKK